VFIMDNKGQAEGFDIMAAALVATILVGFGAGLTFTHLGSAIESQSLYQMQSDLFYLSETIFSDTNCLAGGLANEKNVISQSKISCFSAVDYNSMKARLGVEGYDFKVTVVGAGATYLNYGQSGVKQAISIQRVVTMNNAPLKATVVLYEK
jgi:hypothetical protein